MTGMEQAGSMNALTLGMAGRDVRHRGRHVSVRSSTWCRSPKCRTRRRSSPVLINVRGRVVPLADLRVMSLGMDRPPPDKDTRIVVIEIEIEGETTVAGILADKVLTT